MTQAKVIIADDHPLFRTALKQAIVECIEDDETLEVDNFHDLLKAVNEN
jgi:DNA-binding NarL/FixJ family response regulator